MEMGDAPTVPRKTVFHFAAAWFMTVSHMQQQEGTTL
jgi:hypothetical protein